MGITTAQAGKILEFNFGGRSQVNTTPLYLGLSKTEVTSAGGGVTEPTGNYSRAIIDNTISGASWSVASGGILSNNNEIAFSPSTSEWASTSAPITYVFIADHLTNTGSSIMYYQPLTSSRPVPSETTIYFAQGSLSIQLA